MKLSYILGIAIVLFAVTTAVVLAQEVPITATVNCPAASTLLPSGGYAPALAIPNLFTGTWPGAIAVKHCGPWSVVVHSDQPDGKMRTDAGTALGSALALQCNPNSPGPYCDSAVTPTSTANQRICYDYGNNLESADVVLTQPTALSDQAGTYKMTLTFIFAESL